MQQEDACFLCESVNSDTSHCNKSSSIHVTEKKLMERQMKGRGKNNIICIISALQI